MLFRHGLEPDRLPYPRAGRVPHAAAPDFLLAAGVRGVEVVHAHDPQLVFALPQRGGDIAHNGKIRLIAAAEAGTVHIDVAFAARRQMEQDAAALPALRHRKTPCIIQLFAVSQGAAARAVKAGKQAFGAERHADRDRVRRRLRIKLPFAVEAEPVLPDEARARINVPGDAPGRIDQPFAGLGKELPVLSFFHAFSI